MKNVLVHFEFPQANKQQYDGVWNDLKAAGHGHPKGLLYHVGAQGASCGLIVADVWESEEAFKEFGKILKPILEKNNVVASLRSVTPIYNIYEAQTKPVA